MLIFNSSVIDCSGDHRIQEKRIENLEFEVHQLEKSCR